MVPGAQNLDVFLKLISDFPENQCAKWGVGLPAEIMANILAWEPCPGIGKIIDSGTPRRGKLVHPEVHIRNIFLYGHPDGDIFVVFNEIWGV